MLVYWLKKTYIGGLTPSLPMRKPRAGEGRKGPHCNRKIWNTISHLYERGRKNIYGVPLKGKANRLKRYLTAANEKT